MAYLKLQGGSAAAVTPSDTLDIPAVSNGENNGCVLYVGTGGDLRVLTAGGQDVTFVGVLSGSFFPVNVVRVYATGTAASDIIAIW